MTAMTATIARGAAPPFASSAEEVSPYRWTRREYAQLIEHGILGEDDHVQLIEGDIITMAPQKEPHAAAIMLGRDALQLAFGTGFQVRPQLPLALGPASEPEPDLAVVAGRPRDYLKDHPASAVLVVEISDTTLTFDRGRKGSLYARAGIREYWILNLVRRQLEVYRDPALMPETRYGAGFETRFVVAEDGNVAPLAAPGNPIKVADLLP